jgi:hypothetical protein
MRRWYQKKTKEERRAWVAKRDPERVRAVDRARGYRVYDDQKVKARAALHRALRRGDIVKGECSMRDKGGCRGRIEGHHYDHTKPLEVTWVCQLHHGDIHYPPF